MRSAMAACFTACSRSPNSDCTCGFQHVGALTHEGTLLTGQLAHRPEHTGDAALLAQQPNPQLLQRSGIGRLSDLRRGLLLEGIELIGELLQGDRCAHRDGTESCRL